MRKIRAKVIPKCFTFLIFVNSLLTNLTKCLSRIFQWLDFN
ncbi:putative membrane protein [Candidatus Erwinia dacicola]|uniref:Membrane protein n=1 Tax=Candidatus Erwinia dacicola TaxID=252393 RepID=A0A328TPJ4_9GAMM|nr:putative membrane protein [Candidatus Erwinia dacicola]